MVIEELNKYQGITLINYLKYAERNRVEYEANKIAMRFFAD